MGNFRHTFHRREVLKAMAALGLAAPILPFGLRNFAFAGEPGGKVLIVLHLRGGCDGLNLVSPSNDPDFIAARASDLRVLDDGKDAGYALNSSMGTPIDFRLHNVAGGLNELYKNKQLAFVHACGLTDATRSHFVATDMIEAGVSSETELTRSENGWLARSLSRQNLNPQALQAMAVSSTTAGDLRGLTRVLAAPDINNGLGAVGGAPVASALWDMYGDQPGEVGEAGRLALQLPVVIDQHIQRDAQGHVIPYAPENGANYDSSGGFANALKSLARLIKMDVGLQAVTVDYGSWDTHEYQAGRYRGQLEPMSNGLAAFWNDISAYHDRVTLVAITEFGRRLRSNKSGGTDHGRAGVSLVLGGKVRGGQLVGTWPGMTTANLDEGVDLAVTTDYRQILTEALDHTYGAKNAGVFPSFKGAKSLGLFS